MDEDEEDSKVGADAYEQEVSAKSERRVECMWTGVKHVIRVLTEP